MPSSMEPDWRDPLVYRALLALDRPGFAWEFLRRNPRYRAEAHRGLPVRRARFPCQFETIEASPGGAAHWGLWFHEGPERDARTACAIWREEHDRSVVRVDAIASLAGDADSLDLRRIGVDVTLLSVGGDEPQLLLSDGARHIHLALRSGNLLQGPVRLRYALEGLRDLEPKLLTLRRVAGLWRLGRMPANLFPQERRGPRWIELLRTIDAVHQGASQRDIAAVLFGSATTMRDWRGETDYLRMRVQRLVRAGAAMLGGGYLRLLCEPGARARRKPADAAFWRR